MSKLSDHWKNISPQHRHIVSEMTLGKQLRVLKRFETHAAKWIPKSKDCTMIDWGCGGGLIAQEAANNVDKVWVADIVEDSLKHAMSQSKSDGFLIPDHLDDLEKQLKNSGILDKWNSYKVKWLNCFAVIWHMPGIDYYKNVVDYWISVLNPTHITLQYLDSPTLKQNTMKSDDYFKGDNYLRGLLTKDADIFEPFKNTYSIVYKHRSEEETRPGAFMCHVVLKRI